MTSQQPPLTLHWLDHSKAGRMIWLLYELDTPFTLKPYYKIDDRAPPELAKVHPLGKAPVVEEFKDGQVKVLAESSHITKFLTKHYDTHNAFSLSEEEQELADYYIDLETGTLAPNVLMVILFTIAVKRTPFLIRPVIKIVMNILKGYAMENCTQVFELLESDLAKVAKRVGEHKDIFLVGDKLSSAEIMLFWPISNVVLNWDEWKEEFAKPYKYPNLIRWAHQIRKRTAHVNTQKKERELEALHKA